MNKGRNIAIIMAVLLCISIEFFFMLLGRENSSGVVDGVRYIYESGDLENENIKNYTFYFKKGPSRKCVVTEQEDGSYYVTIDGSDYDYILKGINRKKCDVDYVYNGNFTGSDKEAYEIFTKKLFRTMAYGKEPVLKLYEALMVSFIGAVGALILGKAENLWMKFQRKNYPEEYEPVWDDFKMFRTVGGAMMVAAGVILLVFILF